jgi:hypothetical protein
MMISMKMITTKTGIWIMRRMMRKNIFSSLKVLH